MMFVFEMLRPWLDSLFGVGSVASGLVIIFLFSLFWLGFGILLHIIIKPFVYRLLKLNRRLQRKVGAPRVTYALIDEEKRGLTVSGALIKIIRFMLWFAIAMIVLDGYGVNTTPILASAGVVGIAIAFGTQAFVKDFIAGIVFIAEKTFLVGELIQIDGFTGIVKEIGLRTTKIEDWRGAFLIINNGNINSVINYSRDYSLAVVDVQLGYALDYQPIVLTIQKFIAAYGRKFPEMVEGPMFLGMVDSTDWHVTFRITAKCKPGEYFAVERAIRADLIEYCTAAGLSLPVQRIAPREEPENGK